MSTAPPESPSGWFPDPTGRYEFRWFNGTTWTHDVSVDGHRYVDDGVSPPTISKQPSRALSILAFALGLGAVATAWIPFVFVVGAAAAIAAIVIGIVAVRRVASGRSEARGLAVAGIVLGALAAGLCSVGLILTVKAIDEFEAYTQPGPTEVSIDRCEATGARVVLAGRITNLSTRSRDYDISIQVRLDGRVVDVVHATVSSVAAGATQEWTTSTAASEARTAEPASIRCELAAVNGPFPFGLEPA